MKWTLQSLETTSGYLKHCPITFKPGLNCIIGARGTCKSTIVETIRFAFDCEPKRIKPMVLPPPPGDEIPLPRQGLIYETLGGGTAKCKLECSEEGDGRLYVAERNVDGPSRVFRDGVQQIASETMLHRIEIYSQGALHSIAEEPSRRLALVDRPSQDEVNSLIENQKDINQSIQRLGESIRSRRPEIESRAEKVRDLHPNRHQLKEVLSSRGALSPELEAERLAYEARRKTYTRLKSAVEARERVVTKLRQALAEEVLLTDGIDLAPSLSLPPADRISEALSSTLSWLTMAKSDMALEAKPGQDLEELAKLFEQQSAKFYELRKEQDKANESLKREEALRQSISSMERIAKELEDLTLKQQEETKKREILRGQRDAAADQLYSIRLAHVEEINADYGDYIVLTLQQGILTTEHRQLLEELLRGSNLRNQSEVARQLAETLRPSDLVDAVESGDAKRLADVLGRDLGQMTRLVSHLLDSDRLYELETVMPEDGLEITMVVRGEVRPIGQLSKGQMATALLPLILREANYPLIVDQPEDDLDNAFVSDKLIERVRSLSRDRQLIFVTHNANIPVLGDAENIIVMEMDAPRSAMPPRTGSVDDRKDDIIQILEGGKDAFLQRQDRYGSALAE